MTNKITCHSERSEESLANANANKLRDSSACGLRMTALYKQYSKSLFSFISSKIERHEDAEEILQDTWMSIFDSLPLFRNQSSFLTWAKAIASHEVADFYRKRKLKTFVFSHLPFIGNLVSQALGPELIFEKKELKEELTKALEGLSEGYGQILRLKYIENQKMAMIAQLLNCSEKTVESRLFRARLAFQKVWEKEYQLIIKPSVILSVSEGSRDSSLRSE